MYRSARPLLGLPRASAMMRPQMPFPTPARRLAVAAAAATTTRAAAPPQSRKYSSKATSADMRLSLRMNQAATDKAYSPKEMDRHMAMVQMLLPGTFVPIPFSQLEKTPASFFAYQLARLKQRIKDMGTVVGAKVSSMPSWTKRPRAQLGRAQIVPTAKAMHQRLAAAMADGDKDALFEICTPRLYETLSATVSRRKASEKLTWELVRYNGSPRVVSHKVAMMPPLGRGPVLQQVVVAIGSTQRLGKMDRLTGKPIKGSSRVQKLTEYVVMNREFEPKTWLAKGPWRVWGYTKTTSMEDWKLEQQNMAAMERTDFEKRAGQ